MSVPNLLALTFKTKLVIMDFSVANEND